jgi:hypothetical protein
MMIDCPPQLLHGAKCISQKFKILAAYVIFCAVVHQTGNAQICDKKQSVFFESDKYSITAAEEKKLQKLTAGFGQETDSYFIEIHAFTDSIASEKYNQKLAKNRLNSIVSYLKENSKAQFEIIERVRGEAAPSSSNETEEGRAKNRRVDIFWFKMKDGKILLKGKRNMELEVEKERFFPCGVCESNPQLTEIYTNEEAARAGVPLVATSGCSLITGGMMTFDYDCDGRRRKQILSDTGCPMITVRIPADNYNPRMRLWQATNSTNRRNFTWTEDTFGILDYDEKNKCYIIQTRYCPGAGLNCDMCALGPDNIDLAPRNDSAGVVAVPELIRGPKSTRSWGMNSRKVDRGLQRTSTLWRFRYNGRGSVSFADSGMSKERIGYAYSGTLDRFEAICDSGRCQRLRECWCFEIPLSAYTKIIYFQKKKNYRLKVPLKYRKYNVRLFIPAADTLLSINRVKGSKRKYTFQQPLPDTYVVVYNEAANPNNKRGYDAHVDLMDVKTKYSKRKKIYRAKIKRKQLKRASATS